MTELEKDFSLPAMGERIAELFKGSGPLWDIVSGHAITALDVIDEQVAVRTPVGATGNLRSAWGVVPPQLSGEGVIIGQVVNPSSYGPYADDGRAAGRMPPVNAIELWVKRVIGDADSNSIAWAIAKHIAANGTKGAHMLQDGWTAALPTVDAELTAMLNDVIIELGDSLKQ